MTQTITRTKKRLEVVASNESFFEFDGNCSFYHDGHTCRIYDRSSRETLASFTDPISVVYVEEKQHQQSA